MSAVVRAINTLVPTISIEDLFQFNQQCSFKPCTQYSGPYQSEDRHREDNLNEEDLHFETKVDVH